MNYKGAFMELKKIIESKRCLGCGACINICKLNALSMQFDEKGFEYPQLDEKKCVECNQCFGVCPAVSTNVKTIKHEAKRDKVYSARIKDNEIRMKSSSGGLFYALSEYILKNNGYICGVVWNQDFSVKHICSKNTKDRDAMMQSKYIQSDTSKTFYEVREHLLNGKMVLFTGTPCQCAGLRLFLGSISTDNLFIMDVLCGGNVSPGFFKNYINYIEKKKKGKALSICFRTKKIGWKQHHIRVTLNNTVYEGARKEDEPFFYLYLGKQIIRDSCFDCGFASIKRVSDLTVGDFWGINDPEIDDDRGISFVMLNSSKGEFLFNNVSEELNIEKRSLEIAISKQINLRNPPLKPYTRELFWDDWQQKGADYALQKYTTFGKWNHLKRKIIRMIKGVRS